MLSVKGIYKDGVIKPLTPVQAISGQQVIITFLEEALVDPQDDPLVQEEAAFIAMHDQLREKYFGEYVAIHNQTLVDHDKDLERLSLRISKRFGTEPVWIAPVHESPQEEWVIRSPRLDGDSL